MLPCRPFGYKVGVGEQHARRILVGLENADRLARLDQQRLVILQPLERLDNFVIAFPVARGAANAAVNHQRGRVFSHIGIEIVHQHPQRGFSQPAFGAEIGAVGGADDAAVIETVHVCSFAKSKQVVRILWSLACIGAARSLSQAGGQAPSSSA